jgi:hypothetical protein
VVDLVWGFVVEVFLERLLQMAGGDWVGIGGVLGFSVRCSLFAVLGLLVVVRGRDGKMPSLLGGEWAGCVGESRGFWGDRILVNAATWGESLILGRGCLDKMAWELRSFL